jgi:uncharacterized protein (DUF2342 family)
MRPMRSADTSRVARERQIDAYRRMHPARRADMAAQMSEEAFELAAAGIRLRHPEYDAGQVRWALLRMRLGDRLFSRVWPHAPVVLP